MMEVEFDVSKSSKESIDMLICFISTRKYLPWDASVDKIFSVSLGQTPGEQIS